MRLDQPRPVAPGPTRGPVTFLSPGAFRFSLRAFAPSRVSAKGEEPKDTGSQIEFGATAGFGPHPVARA